MCIFNKKAKEKEEIMEQRITNLENQFSELLNIVADIHSRLAQHLYEDKDLTKGDEVEWDTK